MMKSDSSRHISSYLIIDAHIIDAEAKRDQYGDVAQLPRQQYEMELDKPVDEDERKERVIIIDP